SVSHDLRAPLRHIEGFVEILLSMKSAKLDAESSQHLQTIAEATQKMGRLIDDLLAFSRTARTELTKTRFQLSALVQNVIRDMEPDIGTRRVKWSVAPLPTIEADISLLRQVLLNLLCNALKYTKPRKVACIEIGSRSEEGEDVILV